ncbi:lysine-specific demethylase JMJ17 isoform X2 [Malania oleifera]|uniref:lysine-specific demethylase JMJ17 isoform X2 n=1 Tax=Malania oleifera TaxID=397392 RepID=UPI0025AE6DAB|nr:lysine-specific demethylase JMJ17 isoform X2 [Malania oleifera]
MKDDNQWRLRYGIGVMVPWLYIGMLFSSFCWHFEDHCFYSMNYLHWGEPKCWYSVPGSQACAFEKVMRNSLPDLFDAQPDLLFQLITMLNPSVLQENDVPVYSVLQEPGNFVITFPRSYHGGFNLGLNCAEAVNFAPADWLPHGGIGAGLYQLYHKAAVLSHEELLCVVAKNDYDGKVAPYLKKELIRIYAKEKTWRELLWKNGIINSSPMSPRKRPDYVGTEEDPTCIICHQYLYLSAVVCDCRPSTFVCLEHWEHICECKPSRRRLLYRHTLAELSDLVLKADKIDFEGTPQSRNLRRQLSCSSESAALTKKVEGGHVNHIQLADDWILRSCKILQMPFSSDAFVKVLKDAEQFLWAGSEMDQVRDMAKNLIEAQKWAEGVTDCVSKVEKWLRHQCPDSDKVCLEYVDELLSFNPVPLNEPGLLKLKDHADGARVLIQEINSALSNGLEISELEKLYSRVCGLSIYVKETDKLAQMISTAKVCRDGMRNCISERCPAAVEIDMLYKLKSEVLELQIQLPETEILLNLLREAESCRAQCCEILRGHITLKKIEVLFQELDVFPVKIPELERLRQYHRDAVSWISRFKEAIANVHERMDQENVIEELNCILKDGTSLRIQVDELPLVELELKKACCREKALKACGTKMPMNFIQQLMMEAATLQMQREKIFVDVSGVLAAALCWEERAKHILASEGQMSDFEDVIRTSEDICVILPSLNDVKEAVSMAKSWLKNSMPFLAPSFSSAAAPNSLLKVETLKELVCQSKLLKISLQERKMIQTVLQNCLNWEHGACSLLQDLECLFSLNSISSGAANGLISKIERLVTAVESITKDGLSLGFDFKEIPRLQNAHSSLQWCYKALSFCPIFPSLEEVNLLTEAAEHLPLTCTSTALLSSLLDGVKWLKRASELVVVPCHYRRYKLTDAEEIKVESQMLKVSFPVMVDQLVNAVEKHKLWLEQVHLFFNLNFGDRSFSLLMQLKELGEADAFNCPELDIILSEVEKVEKWKIRCKDIVGTLVGETNPLPGALLKIKHSLDKSLHIYETSREHKEREGCICCFINSDNQEFLTCSTCKDCYHLRCLGPKVDGINDAKEYVCPYCQFIEGGLVPRNGGGLLKSKAKRVELKLLSELLSVAEDFRVRIEEKEILQELVQKTLACRACLTEIVDFTLTCLDEDIGATFRKLTTALKAVEMGGVSDHQGNDSLELALTRNSWKVRVDKLLESLQKPSIQQIQRLLKEGAAISIPSEDHFWQKLMEVKRIGMQWADTAKKVAMDNGALGLDKVLELIKEGENLAVHFEKELKLLRDRSMLYCICRKPYDQRAMIACDQCDEWYHFDCIKLSTAPKIYICPACKPQTEELSTSPLVDEDRSTGAKFGEPQTPSPQHRETRRQMKNKTSVEQKVPVSVDHSNFLRCSSGIDLLLWRNRKPFRRAAKKRIELESLSTFFHIQR